MATKVKLQDGSVLKGKSLFGYLGHFAKEKFLRAGHNTNDSFGSGYLKGTQLKKSREGNSDYDAAAKANNDDLMAQYRTKIKQFGGDDL